MVASVFQVVAMVLLGGAVVFQVVARVLISGSHGVPGGL